MDRVLSPYEKQHLLRFGKELTSVESIGEMPVEYVTGKVEFYRRVFTVSPAVMIPRIETEELIDIVVTAILERLPQPEVSLIDVGTGSGAVGITLALELAKRKNVTLTLADISPDALEVTQKNADALLTNTKSATHTIDYKVVTSNLLESIPANHTFDVIVANLPYIPTQRIQVLDESVKDFEPHLALDGGSDGLFLIKKLVHQLPLHLKSSGFSVLEIDYTHTLPEIIDHTTAVTGTIERDQFNRHRFALLKLV